MHSLFLLYIIFTLSCKSIIFSRDGIDEIFWEDLHNLFSLNKLDLTKPFVILRSPSSEWTLLDYDYKYLQKAFKNYGKLSIDTRTTDCSCFQMENKTIDKQKCYRFVSTFKYLSQQKIRDFHDHKSSFYWDKYETFFTQEQPYEKCIKRFRVQKSMKYILKHWNSFIINDLHNNLNKSKPKLTSRRVSFNVITTRHGRMMYDDISMEVMKHINIQPFFEIFGLTQGLNSLLDMSLWFGSNNYRLIRHTDSSNNLFFVLNGTKTFLLSIPVLLNDKDFPYILYPFIHPSSRSEYPIYSMYDYQYPINYKQYKVTLSKDEVLYLPAGTYHEVTNSNEGSIGINIWFGSKSSEITEQLHQIRLPVSSSVLIDELDGILYLINKVTEYFEHNNSYKQYGFMFNYFRRIYPILDIIYYNNLIFGDCSDENIKWMNMNMIIDIENILKCYENKHMYILLKYASHSCLDITGTEKVKWDEAIKQFLDIFENMDNVNILQHVVAQYLETVLYHLLGDAVFIPVLASLSNI